MSIILLPEGYSVCFVETITLISVLWISISAKFGFGRLCQVALVQRIFILMEALLQHGKGGR